MVRFRGERMEHWVETQIDNCSKHAGRITLDFLFNICPLSNYSLNCFYFGSFCNHADEQTERFYFSHLTCSNKVTTTNLRIDCKHVCTMLYILFHCAPPCISAVYFCCSGCSYARNLHSPVHCSACLCYYSGCKNKSMLFVNFNQLPAVWK